MKNKVNASDLFCLLEMMSANNVVLKMNHLTYQKILGKTFGVDDYRSITNIIPKINGLVIDFDESKLDDSVTLIAKYIPHTSESVEIEIY